MDEDRNNSLWNVLKRLISGRPAFLDIQNNWKKKSKSVNVSWRNNRSQSKPVKQTPIHQNNPLRDARGRKIIPEIKFLRFDDHINGENLDLWLYFKNISKVPVMICRVEIFNTTRHINQLIKPGDVEQIDAYTGRLPSSTTNDIARIVYTERYSGINDVFCAEFFVHFSLYHDSRHYTIHRIDKNGPTLDW